MGDRRLRRIAPALDGGVGEALGVGGEGVEGPVAQEAGWQLDERAGHQDGTAPPATPLLSALSLTAF